MEDVTHDSDSSTDDSHRADDLMVEAERRVSMRSDVIDHFQASLESMVSQGCSVMRSLPGHTHPAHCLTR